MYNAYYDNHKSYLIKPRTRVPPWFSGNDPWHPISVQPLTPFMVAEPRQTHQYHPIKMENPINPHVEWNEKGLWTQPYVLNGSSKRVV